MGMAKDWLRERELEPRDFWPPFAGYIRRERRLKENGVDPCYGLPGKGSDILSRYNFAVFAVGALLVLSGIYYLGEILK
jgi:hypothetical protein